MPSKVLSTIGTGAAYFTDDKSMPKCQTICSPFMLKHFIKDMHSIRRGGKDGSNLPVLKEALGIYEQLRMVWKISVPGAICKYYR